MSQYIHDKWGAEQGFPGGLVYAITQTTDGYLWIGTEKGLVRFDGLNFRLYQPADTPSLPVGPVLGLVADNEGNLWIRMQSPRLLRYRAGKFYDIQADLSRNELGFTAMCRGQQGEVIFYSLLNGLQRHRQGKFVSLASFADRPNFLVLAMAEMPDGNIWMGTRDAGLYRLLNGQLTLVANGLPDSKINYLLPDAQCLWIGTDKGIVLWNGTEIISVRLPQQLSHKQVLTMLRDRDANIWISTATEGLFRFSADGKMTAETSHAHSGKQVTALFEDREGNLWIGTAQGLERLREGVFTTYSTIEGLPAENNGPVFQDALNRTWIAPSAGGLYWMQQTQITRVSVSGLDKDVVYSIAGSEDEIWLGRQRGGLTQLRWQSGAFATTTWTQADGLAQNSIYAVHQSRDGSVWAGTLSAGVSRFRDGHFTTYTNADGLASNTITAIAESPDGAMWFATPNGLSRFALGRWQTYTAQHGLPVGAINCLFDAAGLLWIGTNEGLALLAAGRIQWPVAMPAVLREPILGMAEDKRGFFWIATAERVLHIKRDGLLRGGFNEGDIREYGLADGLRATGGVKRHRSVVADSSGRIWFSLSRGLSVVDPARAANNAPPALVDIQTIAADGRLMEVQGFVRVPSIRQRLTFSFAGLSFAVPERVKFRYRLDGFEQDWNKAVSTHEATYTNLGPGSYRFRVMASNSDGFWNGAEVVVPFEIEPLFWQTWWFRLLGVLTLLLTALLFYRLRLRQLTRQMNLRFEERLAERTRIAQDLHDTLLQGCISASMQLHVAVDQLPADATAKPLLNRVVQLMGQVIEEGRYAVRGLRAAPSNATDLEQALARIPQELALPNPTDFRVIVTGRPKALHPILRDEVYRIGREALVNALRHARAALIEVELEYTFRHLRLLVRDDGCGIDPQILRAGREGHWGLAGMRERAERINAQLHVRSRVGAGTEVELSVPAHLAFQFHPSNWLPQWLTDWYQRSAQQKLPPRKNKEKQ